MAYSTHRNAHWGAGFGFGGLGFGFRQMNPAPVLAPPILRQELAQPEFSKSQSRTAPPPHPTTMDDWHWYTQTEMMKCPSAPRPPSIPYFDSQDDLPDLSFSSSCSSVDMYHNSASPAYYGGLVSPSASESGLGIGLGLGISSDPNQDAYGYGYDYDCEYGYGYGLVGLSYNDHSKYSSSSSKPPSSPSSDSEYESQGISEAFLKEIEFTYLNESSNDAHMSALSTLPSSSTIRDLRDVRGQVRTPVNDISRDAVYCSDAASGDHHIANTAFSPSTPSQSNLVSATSSPTRFRVPVSARIPIPAPMPRRHSSPTPPQMRTHPRLRAVSTSAATHSLSVPCVQGEESSADAVGDASLSKSLPTSDSTATIRAGTETGTSRKSVEGNDTKKDQQQKKPNLSKSRPSSLSRANTITNFRRVSSSALGRGREEKRESDARPMRRVQSLSGPCHSSSRPQTLTQTEKSKEPRPTRARTIPSLSLPKRPASVAGFAVPPVMGSSSSTQVSRTGSLRKEIPRRMSIGVDSRMRSQASAGIRDRTSTLGGTTKETLGASESGKRSQPRTGTSLASSSASGPASTRLSLSVTETGNPVSVPSFSVYVSEPESEKKPGGEATTTRMTMRKRTASSSSGLSENVVAFPFSDAVEASVVTKPGRLTTNYSSVLADKTVRTGSSSLSPSSCSGSGSGSSSSRSTSTSSSKSRSSSRASSPNTTIMARSESSQPRLRAKTNGIATRNGNGKVGNGNRNQNWSASLGSRGRLTSWGV